MTELAPSHECLLWSPSGESADPESSKMEVSLTLTNRFDIFSESQDQPDARGLLLR